MFKKEEGAQSLVKGKGTISQVGARVDSTRTSYYDSFAM